MEIREELRDGVHRAVGLRQEHVHPLLQPDERPHPGRTSSRARSSTTAATSTARTSTRSRCGGGSGWCSRSRTRSRSRSTTTSPSAPGCSGMKADLDGRVERALRQAALWDEVKDRLKDNALGLSGGQQQRLCIARALAVEPDVILMDEPASALDPISTSRIEDLIHELKREYTIVIVTHNMQQAARVADMTAFFSVEVREDGTRPPRDARRVRPDDEDLHQPVRPAHRGLRHGAVRVADGARRVPGRASTRSRPSLQEQGAVVLRAVRGAVNALADAGRRALRRGHRVRRRDRRALPPDRDGRSASCSRSRHPSRPTCASCSRCSTTRSTSSGSATRASRSRS